MLIAFLIIDFHLAWIMVAASIGAKLANNEQQAWRSLNFAAIFTGCFYLVQFSTT